MKTTFALLLAIQLTGVREVPTRPPSPPVISLPRGRITRIYSPDGKWTLIFECPDYRRQRKLWIAHSGAGSRRLVKNYERSLDIGWAPDSRSFFVNDASGSTDTRVYVYDAATLKEAAIEDLLKIADPSANKYFTAGHTYLEAERWINSHELMIRLYGHFDEQRQGFTLRYRSDLESGKFRRVYKSPNEEPSPRTLRLRNLRKGDLSLVIASTAGVTGSG